MTSFTRCGRCWWSVILTRWVRPRWWGVHLPIVLIVVHTRVVIVKCVLAIVLTRYIIQGLAIWAYVLNFTNGFGGGSHLKQCNNVMIRNNET